MSAATGGSSPPICRPSGTGSDRPRRAGLGNSRGWGRRVEGLIFFGLAVQGSVSVLTYIACMPVAPWFTPTAKLAWALLYPAQVLMLGVVVIQAFEMAELLWIRHWA